MNEIVRRIVVFCQWISDRHFLCVLCKFTTAINVPSKLIVNIIITWIINYLEKYESFFSNR